MKPRSQSDTSARTITALLCALTWSGCIAHSRGPHMAENSYPGEVRSSESLPDGLFLHQRVTATYRGHTLSFTAVVETAHGQLRMIALTPFGTRAFLLEQLGTRIVFKRYVDEELPFPPHFILLDLHRTLFLGIDAPPLPDGERTVIRGGEEIRERFEHGLLVQRSFRRVDGHPAGTIDIRYRTGLRDLRSPPPITLRNGWFDYTLSITTLPES